VTRVTPSRSPAADGYSLLVADAFHVGEISDLRRRVARAVRRCGLNQVAADGFIVAVNEVLTNAVRHGGGSGVLRLWAGGAILCEVHDRGRGFASAPYVDRVERPTMTASGGMGLWIAQQTTDGLTIDSDLTGTTVRLVALYPTAGQR
jgi:anti-sigma regulatory factor (Ser/Thr protein kinase)